MMQANTIIILCSVLFLTCLFLFWFVEIRKKEGNRVKRSNYSKETRLLNKILKNIKESPNDWIFIRDSTLYLLDFGFLALVNDNSNVLIVFSGQDAMNIVIVIGTELNSISIKELANRTDAIRLRMEGNHVVRFYTQALHEIDQRGNELEFFEQEILHRL